MTTSLPQPAAATWEDQSKAFHEATHLAGWTSEVAAPGDFFTRDLGSSPVLVCRGDDGSLKAFLNVCSHEGSRVALGCGTAERFVCRRHGWTYDRAGTVVYRPGAIAGPIKLGGRPLRGLPVLERDGFVLVAPRPGVELDPTGISVPAEIGLDWKALGQRGLTLTTSWESAQEAVRSIDGAVSTAVSPYGTLLQLAGHLLLVTAGPGQVDGDAQVSLTLLVEPARVPQDDAETAALTSALDAARQALHERFPTPC